VGQIDDAMFQALQVLTVVLLAMSMAFALAHAAELPGKLRLDEGTYRAVQPIYYPGFTIGGGVAEFGGMVLLVVLLASTPRPSTAFVWTIAALVAFLAMHLVYWLVTHPVNRSWLRGTKVGGVGAAFFRVGRSGDARPSFTKLRDVWEYSHVARAVLALAGLVLLLVAVTS
jgi:hypothetical protein